VEASQKPGRADRREQERQSPFQVTVDHAPIGVALVQLEGPRRGRLLSVNPAFCALFGHPREALVEMALSSIVHPEDALTLLRDLTLLTTDDSARVETELRCLHRDGHTVWVLMSGAAVASGRGSRHAVFYALDIDGRKRFEGHLQYLVDHDALTGLLSRRRFEEELAGKLAHAARYGSCGAVLLIDLDDFKFINDTMGHSSGDELVASLAALLRGIVRSTDVVARLGGDEFAVILQEVGRASAAAVAEKLLRGMRDRPIALSGGQTTRVTASIGVSVFASDTALSAGQLLVEADIAMYQAKERGKNRVALYDRQTPLRPRMLANRSWLDRLRHAAEEGDFELVAQPIHGICSNGRPRYELLLRMRGENGELVPPAAFLHIAERYNLIQQIDRWVFAEAARLINLHEHHGHDISLSVNMSGKTLSEPQIVDELEALLLRTPIPGGRLVVEVTETVAIVNIERARQVAQRLRDLGVRFALDDFGAGFASFYYLKYLEFDDLKIDGEFIKALNDNATDQVVVKSVVQIAHVLGASTIAECVGDDEVLHRLHELGVDYGQGYHLGRPQPIDEILPALLHA